MIQASALETSVSVAARTTYVSGTRTRADFHLHDRVWGVRCASVITCSMLALKFREAFFHSIQSYCSLSCVQGLDFGNKLM